MARSVLRVALLGCGYVAPKHLVGYLRSDRVEIAALVDLQTENAEKLAQQLPSDKPKPKVHAVHSGESDDSARWVAILQARALDNSLYTHVV